MKVTVIAGAEPKDKWPRLMKGKNSGGVYLFEGPRAGTLLTEGGDNINNVGYYSDVWPMDQFVPFYGKVEITS